MTFCFAGTEAMVEDMMAAVDLGHLCAGNLGKTFSKLKLQPDSCPPWEKLKEASFWKESHTFHYMYDLLRGEVVKPQAQMQDAGNVESQLTTAMVDMVHDGKPIQKSAVWGPIDQLQRHRRVHLWYVEVDSDGLTDDICQMIEDNKESSLICVGTEQAIWKTGLMFGQMKESHPLLWRYKVTILYLFLREDPPMGQRQPPQVLVHRRILLATPFNIKTHRPQICTDYTWRPSILLYLMSLFELPPKDVTTTLLYRPHKCRPEADIITRMGQFLGHCPNWQCSFVLHSQQSDLEISSKLKSNMQLAYTQLAQVTHEVAVLRGGNTLNSSTLFPRQSKTASPPKVHDPSESNPDSAIAATKSMPIPADQSVSSGPTLKPFKPPRTRSSSSSSVQSAMSDRAAASKARADAEAMEKDAEATAERAAKKARTQSLKPTVKQSKGKHSAQGEAGTESLSLDDFPSNDY